MVVLFFRKASLSPKLYFEIPIRLKNDAATGKKLPEKSDKVDSIGTFQPALWSNIWNLKAQRVDHSASIPDARAHAWQHGERQGHWC